jgi:MFS family permease
MVARTESAGGETLSTGLVSKLFWRIIPLLLLIVMLNYIDRSNLGFAALQMNSQLGFTPAIYGTGASIFFIGYVCAQIPATLLIHRFGARRTIAWIMVAWGLIAAAMALISDTTSFYTLRFLLAVAEAGMIPGATLYISQWFPQSERARAIGTLYTATAAAVVIGGPLSSRGNGCSSSRPCRQSSLASSSGACSPTIPAVLPGSTRASVTSWSPAWRERGAIPARRPSPAAGPCW